MTEINFCPDPAMFLLGNQSSKLNKRPKKVIKFNTKSGKVKIDFRSLFLDLKANKQSENNTAKKEVKSPYQAKAILDETLKTKRIKNVLVRNFSATLKSNSTAYETPSMPRLMPTLSP